MRILSGQFKGKSLSAGSDLSIRPITNRLKEIIFSVLQDYISDKKILDLFSGSGSLGLEALSCGADHVTFVEKEQSSIKVLLKNLQDLQIHSDDFEIIKSDSLLFLQKCRKKYDLIFSDPPFKYPELQPLINQIFSGNCLELKGLLVLHHEVSNLFQINEVPYTLIKQKKVGRSLLSFIIKETNNV
jgi:16S rRNA (guanine(966)-N(2))-methyltransferase RsmD